MMQTTSWSAGLPNRLPGDIITPKPRLTHEDLDAAIMATIMLYERK
jgi:hypothetical protein